MPVDFPRLGVLMLNRIGVSLHKRASCPKVRTPGPPGYRLPRRVACTQHSLGVFLGLASFESTGAVCAKRLGVAKGRDRYFLQLVVQFHQKRCLPGLFATLQFPHQKAYVTCDMSHKTFARILSLGDPGIGSEGERNHCFAVMQ